MVELGTLWMVCRNKNVGPIDIIEHAASQSTTPPCEIRALLTPYFLFSTFSSITDCEKSPRVCISENLYLEQAQQLVLGGYREAGYRYVVRSLFSSKYLRGFQCSGYRFILITFIGLHRNRILMTAGVKRSAIAMVVFMKIPNAFLVV